MLKNPIPKVSNQLQYRAIGIINGKFTPHDNEQLNRGFLIDKKGEKIETVVLGKALSLLKKHIDLNKNYYWVVYPKNKNTQNLHLQVAGIWNPVELNDLPKNSLKINFSKLLEELDLKDNYFSWIMKEDGSYSKYELDSSDNRSQIDLIEKQNKY